MLRKVIAGRRHRGLRPAFAPNPGARTSAPFGNGESFWTVVTDDAGAKGGAAPSCSANVRAAWPALFKLGRTAAGRAQLQRVFRLCDSTPLRTTDDVKRLALFVLNAFDTMAMGNFPYPTVFQQTHDPAVLLPASPCAPPASTCAPPRASAHPPLIPTSSA